MENFKYFDCDEETSGSLLKFNKKYFGLSFLKAYLKKYFRTKDIQNLEDLDDEHLLTYFENMETEQYEKKQVDIFQDSVFKTSKQLKSIEFFGFENVYEIWKDFQKLEKIFLDQMSIVDFGPLGKIGKIF